MIEKPEDQGPVLCLSSGSKQRLDLLQQIQVQSLVMPADIDESRLAGEAVEDYVYRLAMAKARAGYAAVGERLPALGADTVVYNQGNVLGKPGDTEEARLMLSELSGRTHVVLTGAGIVCSRGERGIVVSTKVTFTRLSAAAIDRYRATGEPMGKAGAYAIQGAGGQFVTHIEGSYTNVVGLPLFETAQLLRFAGLDCVLCD